MRRDVRARIRRDSFTVFVFKVVDPVHTSIAQVQKNLAFPVPCCRVDGRTIIEVEFRPALPLVIPEIEVVISADSENFAVAGTQISECLVTHFFKGAVFTLNHNFLAGVVSYVKFVG